MLKVTTSVGVAHLIPIRRSDGSRIAVTTVDGEHIGHINVIDGFYTTSLPNSKVYANRSSAIMALQRAA